MARLKIFEFENKPNSNINIKIVIKSYNFDHAISLLQSAVGYNEDFILISSKNELKYMENKYNCPKCDTELLIGQQCVYCLKRSGVILMPDYLVLEQRLKELEEENIWLKANCETHAGNVLKILNLEEEVDNLKKERKTLKNNLVQADIIKSGCRVCKCFAGTTCANSWHYDNKGN